MIEAEEKLRLERAVERELIAGQRREPLWSDLLQEADGDEKNAKRAYIKVRVEQLVEGEMDRRKKRRRKHKKRSYHDRNTLSLMFGRRIIFGVMITAAVVVLFLVFLLDHTESSRWLDFFSNQNPELPDEWDPTQ